MARQTPPYTNILKHNELSIKTVKRGPQTYIDYSLISFLERKGEEEYQGSLKAYTNK